MPTHQEVDEELRQMEVDDQCEHQATEEYVEDSDNDDQLEIHDEELDEIMGFVFGSESDTKEYDSWTH